MTFHDLNQNDWWQDAVIYQVYPRSFRDSNGDGDGDLPGVIAGLPYLADLGIDAIWLSPFYRTPNRDGGYDIADPRDVDPRFGTLDDAAELINQAHRLGIKVIFDIVPNHFSSDHLWFQDALAAGPGTPERARFHFYDGRGVDGNEPPNNWESIFSGSAWTRVTEPDGSAGQWYLHLFDSTQPDLNWNNKDVREDFEHTLRFWLDMGLDGFRIDVAHGLVKDEIFADHPDPAGLTEALRVDISGMDRDRRIALLSDIPFFDRDGVHAIYRNWREIIDEYSPTRMTVAECYVYPASRLARYVREGELHQVFNFDFLLVDWDAQAIRKSIEQVMATFADAGAPTTWALNNHDSRRVASRLGSEEKARALAMIAHALPGSLYIYQGEELGLSDGELAPEDRQDPLYFRSNGADLGRDGARVPLPWVSDSENFGFTSGQPWLPMPESYGPRAITTEIAEPESTLTLYMQSLFLRKNHPGLGGNGEITFNEAPEGVLSFSRDEGIEVLANTSDEEIQMELGEEAEIILSSNEGAWLEGDVLSLPAHTTVWLQF